MVSLAFSTIFQRFSMPFVFLVVNNALIFPKNMYIYILGDINKKMERYFEI
jgi:hypothetical protein